MCSFFLYLFVCKNVDVFMIRLQKTLDETEKRLQNTQRETEQTTLENIERNRETSVLKNTVFQDGGLGKFAYAGRSSCWRPFQRRDKRHRDDIGRRDILKSLLNRSFKTTSKCLYQCSCGQVCPASHVFFRPLARPRCRHACASALLLVIGR